jgi:dihydroxyacetone kinase
MLDALIPLAQAFNEASQGGASAKDISAACVAAAREGRDSTRTLIAKAGRASYVPEECQAGVTDPGAEAVVVIMEAVDSTLC